MKPPTNDILEEILWKIGVLAVLAVIILIELTK